MKFYRMKGGRSGEGVNGRRRWEIPLIDCNVCGSCLPGGFCYPAADLSGIADQARFDLRRISIDGMRSLQTEIRATLPSDVPIAPKAEFGSYSIWLLESRMEDLVIPWGESVLLVSEDALRDAHEAELLMGASVPIHSEPAVKLARNYFEIQVDEFASVVPESDEVGTRCPECGFLLAVGTPKKFVLRASTIPRGTDLFRLAEYPFILIASERFREFVASRGCKGISFEPVKLDTKKPSIEMLRAPRGVKPEVWPLHREPKSPGKAKEPVSQPQRKGFDLAGVLQSRLPHQAKALFALAKPAISISAAETQADQPGIGTSRFGGLPDVPVGFKWPKRGRRPLTFLAQIVLSEIAAYQVDEALPKEGCIWFFYDFEEQPWGLEPSDCEGWRVFYGRASETALKRAALPRGLDQGDVLPESKLTFRSCTTLPAAASQEIEALKLSEAEAATYGAVLTGMLSADEDPPPLHQLVGHPAPVQAGDMRLECQLRLEGIGSEQEAERIEAKGNKLRSAANDWRLLLQLDSDPMADFGWADSGRLYFWIRKADLAAKRFDRCWLILQSH